MSREIVCKLIDQIQTSLESQEIIKLNDKEICMEAKNNNLKFLENCIDKVGIYIFYENENPVYIGVGGINAKQDLKIRISQEFRYYDTKKKKGDSGATLSKNMKKLKDGFCEELKKMTLKICVFNEKNSRNQDLAIRLEHLLIGIYNPKYNRG